MLTEIFAVAGPVSAAKIIPDRHFQHGGLNYGFVEYTDLRAAETALQTLNGRRIFDTEIRVNWAYQNQQAGGAAGGGAAGMGVPGGGGPREDTHNHYHVFVGDLSPEVNDEALTRAFSAFPTMSEARVMWDMNSGKSRGYGFLAFRDKSDAEQAIETMNGEWLGSRAIRVNWANQKTQTGGIRPAGTPLAGGYPAMSGPLDPATVASQTPATNSTIYIGNLIPYTSQSDLLPLFQPYGYIMEIRMQADRGFAFVKMDSHESAARAIVGLQGVAVHGRGVKCSWGKDRDGGAAPTGGAVGAMPPVAGNPAAAYGAVYPGQAGMGMMQAAAYPPHMVSPNMF